jgi:hypothetical protein
LVSPKFSKSPRIKIIIRNLPLGNGRGRDMKYRRGGAGGVSEYEWGFYIFNPGGFNLLNP